MDNQLLTIYINGDAYQVDGNDNLLAAVLSNKLNLPYFCWHPAMGSVGACRQCAVTQYQDEHDKKGRIVMACTTPVAEGMRISINDHASQEFREQVIGAMMTNHPHDCPVCAEGGECHLQDMTVMTGHTSRNYEGLKRTFTNQDLGQFVGHEMNRCITCYRCVRFYKDYAGGEDLGVFGSKNQVYFGRQEDGQLESEFSGNLVEVCPTGVFTNKHFSAHYARKWDLQSAPSICANCSVGCNLSVGERYGSVRRVMNRYHHELNGYFICDHGRFGLSYVNSNKRLTRTKGIDHSSPMGLKKQDVVRALLHYRKKQFLAIGSGRASIESNQLLREIVGVRNFSTGFSATQLPFAKQHADYLSRHQPVSLAEIEQADFVLIIDEDITQSAARIALSVRQALRNKGIARAQSMGIPSWQDSAVRTIAGEQKSPLYIFTSVATKLDSVASARYLQSPEETKLAVEQLIAVLTNKHREHEINPNILQIADALIQAKKPLVISGWSHQHHGLFSSSIALIDAVSACHSNSCSLMTAPEANTVGQLYLTTEITQSVEQTIEQTITDSDIAGLIVLEHELPSLSKAQIERLNSANKLCIAIDHSDGKFTQAANMVLPATPVTESHGHFANYQGRVQSFYAVTPPILPIQNAWQWLCLLASGLEKLSDELTVINSFSTLHEWFEKHVDRWPIKLDASDTSIAREPHRVSGRTAKMANQTVHEAKTTQSEEAYRFSMEGGAIDTGDNMPYVWAPGWNSNQAITFYQQRPNGPLMNRQSAKFLSFNEQPFHQYQSVDEGKPANTEHNDVSLAMSVPWFRRFWLTRSQAEFSMMVQANVLYVSKSYANKQQLAVKQWVKVSLSKKNQSTRQEVFAQLMIDDDLPVNHLYLQADELHENHWQLVSVTLADEQALEQWHKQVENRLKSAELEQKNTLTRLKEKDQTIPIRLVSGGLEDA
ncbi:NADH-quinone oxidoreductase subunit NuoG [Thalassotalea sp. 1_MG-2023]|uniref:NADH-quinone oxidoreductase subunit NuoG n=1 Tax=Thalassotalea sp. 1_MG-2023 TaxID=3062680 RepID=UPI0026E43130|nr:NADH-quinone oxidoreductase subunit NuoG [Thalassotalea sp. 1_MG-2023]MDO6426587.1 NADH-quinone oxidoreductase subunit NuoG [Thalassotalea sp. 1_MG-2023]